MYWPLGRGCIDRGAFHSEPLQGRHQNQLVEWGDCDLVNPENGSGPVETHPEAQPTILMIVSYCGEENWGFDSKSCRPQSTVVPSWTFCDPQTKKQATYNYIRFLPKAISPLGQSILIPCTKLYSFPGKYNIKAYNIFCAEEK